MQPPHPRAMSPTTTCPFRSAPHDECDPARGSSRQGTHAPSRPLWPLLAFAALASACSNLDRTSAVESPIIESQAGPVAVEVLSNGAAGIPDSELAKLVQVGVRRGCRREAGDRIEAVAGPMLLIRWEVQRAGAPHPLVLVTASLFSQNRRVSFVFDHILSPDAAPYAVFEYAIASLTCELYRNAGYLAGIGPDVPAPKSKN